MTYKYGVQKGKDGITTYPNQFRESSEVDTSGRFDVIVTYSMPLTENVIKKYKLVFLGGKGNKTAKKGKRTSITE